MTVHFISQLSKSGEKKIIENLKIYLNDCIKELTEIIKICKDNKRTIARSYFEGKKDSYKDVLAVIE